MRRRRAPPWLSSSLVTKLAMSRQRRIDMLLEHGNVCVYCGDANKEVTQDHAQPVSRDGVDRPENIFPACRECNERKGNRSAEEFAPFCPPNAPIHKILQRRHPKRA